MNKPKYAKKIFLCIILTMFTWYGPTQSQPALDAQGIAQDVGRENPFAKISRAVKPVSRAALQSSEPIDVAPELFLQTIMLKFLDAKSLQQAMNNMPSKYGSISIDATNNSLIVCDSKEKVEKIIFEIKKADKTPRQIMVEMVIVDVELSDDTEMGVNWDILSNTVYDLGYRQNFTTRLGSTLKDESSIGNATAFNTTGHGGDFSVVSGNIRNVVSLLQQKKNVEILASPRVMVVSGKTASIEAVRELPYNEVTDTSAGGSLSSTEFKKVGITMDVTATLTEDDLIFLNVNSEQNVIVGQSVTDVPIIDTRTAKSEVLLNDGQVVIIGGLRRKELTKQADQIPILGDIPLIGFIFRYTHTVVNNNELIVFLSPHIYKDEEPIDEDAMKKFKEIKNRPIPSLEKAGDDKK